VADDRDLVVLIAGRRAGVVAMDTQGRFALRYDEEYRAGRNPTPLSLSMPLAQSHHGDGPVRAFLWGLLPDNEQVLQRWARTYQVSAGNPFALLRHVGEDCAGASSTPWPTTGSSGYRLPRQELLRSAVRLPGAPGQALRHRNGLDAIHGRHWRRFATDNRLDPDETVARVGDLAIRAPEAFATSATESDVRALNSQLPSRLTDRVAARATHCRKKLEQ